MRRVLTFITLLAAVTLIAAATVGTATARASGSYDVTLTLSKSTAFVNDYVRFHGSVHTASGKTASGTVVIQKRRASGGSWISWRTDRLDAGGAFSKRVRMTSRRTWEFRAKMPGDSRNDRGFSPLRRLRVNGPTAAEAKVLRLVNAQRTKRGLRPVKVRYDLTRAARAHSAEMARRRILTHSCANGDSVATRLRSYGYTTSGCSYWRVGEDIAWGTQGSLHATPTAIVAAWMKSTSHRRVILTSNFRDAGVGIKSADGRSWFTLDLGRRIR